MKTITVTEPWASLISIGAKKIETRSWYTDFRGPIAIHAAKGITGADLDWFFDCYEALDAFEQAGWVGWSGYRPKVKDAFPGTRGSIIATATLVDCVRFYGGIDTYVAQGRRFSLTQRERAFGDFTPGRYGFLLTDVVRLPQPVPVKGALGLWNWDEDVQQSA